MAGNNSNRKKKFAASFHAARLIDVVERVAIDIVPFDDIRLGRLGHCDAVGF